MRANRHSCPPELAPTPNERISEISRLVNTMEKVALLEFSIRVFGSVYGSGSQKLTSNCLWLLVNALAPTILRESRGFAQYRGFPELSAAVPDSALRLLVTQIAARRHLL